MIFVLIFTALILFCDTIIPMPKDADFKRGCKVFMVLASIGYIISRFHS
jgi:hypothetical protein